MNQNCSHLDIVTTLELSVSFYLKYASTMAPLSRVIIYNKVCISRGKVRMAIAQALFGNNFKELCTLQYYHLCDKLLLSLHTLICIKSWFGCIAS